MINRTMNICIHTCASVAHDAATGATPALLYRPIMYVLKNACAHVLYIHI